MLDTTNPDSPVGGADSHDCPPEAMSRSRYSTAIGLTTYLMLGAAFGIVLIKSEVVSWFRIQEMFRFEAFYMYGVIGGAVITAGLSLQVIKRSKMRTLSGDRIVVPPKALGTGTRYCLGGAVFGLGWGIVGACPGPIFALIGSGLSVMVVTLGAAIAGTWAYGALRPRLPH